MKFPCMKQQQRNELITAKYFPIFEKIIDQKFPHKLPGTKYSSG